MTKEQIWRVKDGSGRQKLYIALECIESLEKENEILKDRAEGFKKQIIGLCEKHHQVYERFPELKDSFLLGDRIVQENNQLKAQIEKLKEEKQYETCPYRSTDMGCDYCDYRDRDLKDEVVE